MENPNRYCQACGHDHGPLYICPSYPQDLQRQLELEQREFSVLVRDPLWQENQRAKGVPEGIIEWTKILAGA